ncbi:hypothetical protein E0H70_08185 [Rhizobium leguminosarum bv. viciae]|nr:hypothetical protein E0H70_08185 [Rhizobium leguminosarum bv. viciae]
MFRGYKRLLASSAFLSVWLFADASGASDRDYMVAYPPQLEIIDKWLADIADGKRLWTLISDPSIVKPPTPQNQGQPASEAEIASYIALVRNPAVYHSGYISKYTYPCSHFLLPSSTMKTDYFGVSGNDNGTLIGGADIIASYSDANRSPVVFIDDSKATHVLKSALLNVAYEANVGGSSLDPTGAHFVMDANDCQIKSYEQW